MENLTLEDITCIMREATEELQRLRAEVQSWQGLYKTAVGESERLAADVIRLRNELDDMRGKLNVANFQSYDAANREIAGLRERERQVLAQQDRIQHENSVLRADLEAERKRAEGLAMTITNALYHLNRRPA